MKKRFNNNAIAALLVCLGLFSCKKDTVEVSRELNASWLNGKTSKILITTSIYDSKSPEKAYYEDLTATNWRMRLVTTDSLLQNPQTVMEILDPSIGDFQNQNFYYFTNAQGEERATAIAKNKGYMFNLATKTQTELVVSEPFRQSYFTEARTAPQIASAIPAPNGSLIAAFVFAPQTITDGSGGQRQVYVQAIAFFNATTGSFAKANILPYTLTDSIPELVPQNNLDAPLYFLWNKTSTGVYVMTKKSAYYISANFEIPAPTAQVPALALPTQTGSVNGAGSRLQRNFVSNKQSIVKTQIPNWLPFAGITLIPQGTQTYSK